MKTKKTIRLFACLMSVMLMTACSSILPRRATEAEKQTLVRVAAEYLGHVKTGNSDVLGNLVFWPEYLENSSARFSKVRYFALLEQVAGQLNRNNHPLSNLDVKDIQVRKNHGVVFFRKIDDNAAPSIWVKLHWVGNGWVIADDSLFDDGGLFSTLTTDNANLS